MSKLETQDLSAELKIAQLRHSLDNASKALTEFTKLAEGSQELREWATNEITKYALSIRASKLDKDELENFFKYPYCIIPGKHEGEVYLAIPKFVDAHFGWLHKVTPSFNIFLVNQYVDWLGELPAALKKELKFADPLDVHLDGEYLIGPDTAKAYNKNPQFFTKQKDGRLLVNKTRHFEMLAALIKDGILPFVPKPVPKEDMVIRKCDFELRDYQEAAWFEFCKYSNIGAFFPPSTGKTFLALYAMTHIKGPHLVVVPSRLLIEQWKERIELYTDLQPDEYEVLTYYSGIKTGKQYKILIIDEVHHLPSNEFSKLSNVKRDYCIGLSACISADSQILCETGFEHAGLLRNQNISLYGVDKKSLELVKQTASVLDTRWLGNKSPFNIKTRTKSLDCTGDHPFLTWKLGKMKHEYIRYVKARNLENNNLVATSTLLPLPSGLELIRLLGFAYGDSHLRNSANYNRLTFIGSLSEMQEIKKNLNRIDFTCRIDKKDTDSAYNLDVHGSSLGKILGDKNAPIGRKTIQKIIPPILKDTLEKRCFLSGIFGAEGSTPVLRKRMVHYTGEHPDEVRLIMATKKPDNLESFFKFIQRCLNDLDIESVLSEPNHRKWKRIWKGRQSIGDNYSFTLRIKSNSKNMIKFLEQIEFAYSPEKQKQANKVLAWLYSKEYDLQIKANRIKSHTTNFNEDKSIQLRKHDVLIPLVTSFIRWEKVSSVKRLVKKFRLIDVVAPKTSNFIANGFVTHNTPQREDQREEYIFALTGKPVGLAWETFKKLGIIQNPPLHVWIVKNEVERIKQLSSLLQEEHKTIIFCDSIELGTTISKRFELPHIHGNSKERLAAIKDAPAAVVSRVGDEGISLPDITRVIEVSWLHGSRRQELQRFTRLLHGRGTNGEGHIIMTGQEYQTDHKRLFGVMDKGFKIVLHREGISDKLITAARSEVSPKTRARIPSQKPAGLLSDQKPKTQIDFNDPFLKLPGVQKLLEKCSKSEIGVIQILYKEKEKPFTSTALAMLLGLSAARGTISFSKLLKMGLIKKVGGKYQADPTLGGAMN